MKRFALCLIVALVILPSVAHVTEDAAIRAVESAIVRKIYVPFSPPPPSMYYVPDQMIVQVKPSVMEVSDEAVERVAFANYASLEDLNKRYKVSRFFREFPDAGSPTFDTSANGLSRYYVVYFGKEFQLKEVMAAYRADEWVEKVEAIGVHPILERFPNDTYFFSDQWNMYDDNDNDVDATDAWDLETGSGTIILGDLDTGLQYTSRDLGGLSPYTSGNVWINQQEYEGTPGVDDDGNGYVDDWIGWDFVDNVYPLWPGEDGDTPDNEPTDFNGHGTHVGGIMGAITNNSYMVAGLAGGWYEGSGPANGVKIMALRIGWSAPYGGQEVGYVRMDFAAQAIYYAVNKGVTAINCSWGSSNSGGLGAAVDYAGSHGVIVVHAAGNDGNSVADYLGSRTDVINVAATDSADVKAGFSNFGTWVDIAAPGVDVLSTYSYHYNPNYIAWVSGTSQAAPHVTAAAGLLKSYVGTSTASEITDLILDYTDNIDTQNPGYVGLLGSGRLNVFKALDAAIAPAVTVIQPNGGEVLYIGQQYDVTWDASDNVGIDSCVIDYSVDSGDTWMYIGTVAGNPGVYTWTVTGPPSSTCRMRVTAYDAVGVSGSDISDDDFCPPYLSDGSDGRVKQRRYITIMGGENEIPSRTALFQNYPNPFNPSTQIRYCLRSKGHVRLSVFNVLGRRICTLVDETQEAGYRSVDWKATGCTSGVYFYRLETNDFLETKKMILMR